MLQRRKPLRSKANREHNCEGMRACRRLQLFLEKFFPGELGAGDSVADTAIRLLVRKHGLPVKP